MASAVLPSRNEHHWSELDGNLRQFTSKPHLQARLNPNSNPSGYRNPNYNLTGRVSDHTTETALLPSNAPSPRLPPLPPAVIDDAPLANRNKVPVQSKDSFHREHVTFHLSSYSKSELKELKMRLILDLERVRALLTRIETRELESGRGFLCPLVSLPAVETNQNPFSPPAEERAPNPRGRPPVALTGNRKNNHQIGGHKRALLASIDGRETKRPMAASTQAKAKKAKALVIMINKCKHVLNTLMTHRYGYVFNKPVDVVGLKLYDYYEVIKHPMDLGTIKTRLTKREYKSPLDFAADVRLTFDNAMNYNPKGSHVHNIAESMLLSFEKNFQRDLQQYVAQKQRGFAPKMNQNISQVRRDWDSPVVMPIEPIVLSSPSSQKEPVWLPRGVPQSKKGGKLPKPKAKDPNKRQITDEEKGELISNLESLPLEKMEQTVHIVRKRNPKLTLEGNEEVEIDIDALDNETLWELDRFVSNHLKKEVIKIRTQEFRYDAITLIQEDTTKPKFSDREPLEVLDMENDKKGDAGEEFVDIGEDAPPNEFPPVEIEKDPVGASSGSSSSSSSSSDDSSSSDSDTGSTSESDCFEDNVQSPAAKVY